MMKFCCCLVALLGLNALATELPEPYIWWKMDKVESGVIRNSGTNTDSRCHLTLGPSVTLQPLYGVQNAIYFDAATAVATGSYATSYTPATKSRTIAFWICRDADNTKFDPAVNKNHFIIAGASKCNIMVGPNATGMTVRLGAKEGTAEEIDHSYFNNIGNFTRDRWHHIVFVAEDTGATNEVAGTYFGNPIYNVRCYQDGALYKEVLGRVTETGLDQAGSFYVGNNGIGSSRPLPGALSDMRFYDCALSTAQVTELWNVEQASHAPQVLGFWRMEEILKTADDEPYIADASGAGLSLMLGASNALMSAAGCRGQALDFPDSTECHGQASYKGPLLRDFSIALWMRPNLGMDRLSSTSVNNTNPNIFNFGGYFRSSFGHAQDGCAYDDIYLADMASVTNNMAPVPSFYRAYSAKGHWSHLAVVAKAEQDSEGKWSVAPKVYCNAKLIYTGRRMSCPKFESSGCYPADILFTLGNMKVGGNRAMWGQMDDVVFFGKALTDGQVKRIYAGFPEVDAGDDFSVARETARLAGKLPLVHGDDADRATRQDSAVWTLVSAPEGATPVIAAPDDLNTEVTLPVAGEYVFRLTVSLEGLSDCDEVTVTRVAELPGTAPTLTVTAPASAVAGEPVALSASVGGASGVRVFWGQVSGPGAVGFEPSAGLNTVAHFGAAGAYTLRATADDGARTTTNDFAVTVTSGDDVDIAEGLIGYWPFDGEKGDAVSGQLLDQNHLMQSAQFRRGVDGYGYEVVATNGYTIYTWRTLQEEPLYPGAVDDSTKTNTIPKDRWRSLSLWFKYNPNSDTNGAIGSVLAEARYTLGLFYDKTNGFDRITMYQQTMCSKVGGGNFDYYNLSSLSVPSFDNRWVHVYAAFDRNTHKDNNQSELWIDGVRQTVSTKGMGGGRVIADGHLQFGNINASSGTAGANDRWHNCPRTFPGALDEVRLYNRKLNASEIRYLAQHPVVGVNYAPAANITAPERLLKGTAMAAAAAVADDDLPEGSTLTGRWVVLAGDAANLEIADPTARSTTVKARKRGTFTLAYAVTDGDKTTYSAPRTYTVESAGMIIFIN